MMMKQTMIMALAWLGILISKDRAFSYCGISVYQIKVLIV